MGGFISAPPNLASPSAIGSTTPNTGRFTTLTLAPSANTTPFTASGYSLTGANAQSFFDLSGTWNTSGTPTAIKLNVTDTASNASSLLMDLQQNGISRIKVQKNGDITATGVINCYGTNVHLGSYGVQVGTNAAFAFGSTTNSSGGVDLALTRDGAAGTLAQRLGTNAQTFRLYRTYTDASNYERLGFLTTNTTRYTITSQNAGTGSARSLEISFYTASSDPTSTDITSGCFSVWKNSGTGTIKLWANDGGTMKSVALA